MKMTKKPGYIIPLTLLIISLAVVIITAVVRESFSYQKQARIAQDKARARLLALSSLELVLSQLSFIVPQEKEDKNGKNDKKKESQKPKKSAGNAPPGAKDKDDEKDEVSEPLQKWMLKVIPLLNHWHTLELAPSGDVIEGTISYYISCENGKINLDELAKELKGKQEKEEKKEDQAQAQPGKGKTNKSAQPGQQPGGQPSTGQQPGAQPQSNGANNQAKKPGQEKPGEEQKKSLITLVDQLVKKEKEVSIREALKKLEVPIEDATEFLRTPQFSKLKDGLFVTQELPKKPLFLMDLFTTHRDGTLEDEVKLNPWLLSQSVKTLLDLKENKEVKIDKNFIKNLRPTMNWSQDWDKALSKLYGKKFEALEKSIKDLFATEFEATAFSVVSYCRVGMVTQRIGALVELTEPSPEVSPKSFIFRVTRLYWL